MPSNNELRTSAGQIVDGLIAMMNEQQLTPQEGETLLKEIIKALKAYVK